MDQREGFQPTMPQHAVVQLQLPHAPVPPRPSRRMEIAILLVVVAMLVSIGIGVAIGRETSSTPATPAVTAGDVGHLNVTSSPVPGNVLIDGRFAGVAPIARLDLDAGRHSVVIDAFGYQPYSGTLEIEARGKLNLSVLLAPIGVEGATSGNVSGTGKATRAVVPPSALLPVTGGAAAAPAAPAAPEPKKATHRAEAPAPAAPPRRDCDGERSRCQDSCRRASTDCDFSCPGCSSCNTSVGWDECKRQCDTCRSSCANNTKFCESSCDSQRDNCEASQR
jgi:hypothetical protein